MSVTVLKQILLSIFTIFTENIYQLKFKFYLGICVLKFYILYLK